MKISKVLYALILSISLSFLLSCTNKIACEDNCNQYAQCDIVDKTAITDTSISDSKQIKDSISKSFKGNLQSDGLIDINCIPSYSGKAYTIVNNNIPYFDMNNMIAKSYEQYSPIDSLGRCGTAFACIGMDVLPSEERGSIGNVKPSGWHTIRYKNIDGKYLYNRCHLIGYQLSGENSNERNLITGTRYMNINGMLPFENMVADYIQKTHNHVMYRVTPIFVENNLLSSGVHMEAFSVEDNGNGICFNVFCYNVQPGIKLNYANGNSESEDGSAPYGSSATVIESGKNDKNNLSNIQIYIANKNTKKFHYVYCKSVEQMNETNKHELHCTRNQLISAGYSPCANCNP